MNKIKILLGKEISKEQIRKAAQISEKSFKTSKSKFSLYRTV